jgi:hypothetical protein
MAVAPKGKTPERATQSNTPEQRHPCGTPVTVWFEQARPNESDLEIDTPVT